MTTIKFLEILPNHWEEPVKEALKTMGKNGNLPNVIRCERNNSLTSFDKFQLEMICDELQLLQLGVQIGISLMREIGATPITVTP